MDIGSIGGLAQPLQPQKPQEPVSPPTETEAVSTEASTVAGSTAVQGEHVAAEDKPAGEGRLIDVFA